MVDCRGEMVARITRAELREPYAALLAERLAPEVLDEAELIRSGRWNAEPDPEESASSACSNFLKLAEREGFEPSNEVDPRYAISSRARSTAPAPLRSIWKAGPHAAPPPARMRAGRIGACADPNSLVHT